MTDPGGGDELRVGTAERENAATLLGTHLAEGRLSLEEYEERMATALEAVTRRDMLPLFADLPAPHPTFMAPPAPPPAVRPATAVEPAELSDKNRIVAGALQILLPFGIGRFYTGHTGMAAAQLFSAFLFIGVVWSFIDGVILILTGGTDADGRELRT